MLSNNELQDSDEFNESEEDDVLVFSRKSKKRLLSTDSEESTAGYDETIIPEDAEAVATSTPLNDCPTIDALKNSVNESLECHRSEMKKLRNEERANNEEFLSVLHVLLTGENEIHENNDDGEPILWKGENLMSLYAGPEPSKFGRKLGMKMFGEKEFSLLKTHIIGPVRNRKDTRSAVPEDQRKIFESN